MPPRVKQTAAERQRQKYPDSFLVLFYNPSGKHKDTFSIDGTHCIYAGQDKIRLYDNLLADNDTPAYIFKKLTRPDATGNYYELVGRAVHRTNPRPRDINIPPKYHCTIQPADDLRRPRGIPVMTAQTATSRSWCKEKVIHDYGLMKLSGNYDQGILLVRPK
jgi:hypothetical protein